MSKFDFVLSFQNFTLGFWHTVESNATKLTNFFSTRCGLNFSSGDSEQACGNVIPIAGSQTPGYNVSFCSLVDSTVPKFLVDCLNLIFNNDASIAAKSEKPSYLPIVVMLGSVSFVVVGVVIYTWRQGKAADAYEAAKKKSGGPKEPYLQKQDSMRTIVLDPVTETAEIRRVSPKKFSSERGSSSLSPTSTPKGGSRFGLSKPPSPQSRSTTDGEMNDEIKSNVP